MLRQQAHPTARKRLGTKGWGFRPTEPPLQALAPTTCMISVNAVPSLHPRNMSPWVMRFESH
jgi:hypothetical protein